MSKWVTLLGLVGMASFASASTIIDKITGDDIFSGMKDRTSMNADCANFSGKWKGACTKEDGKKQEAEFEIKQEGCEYISMKDHEFPIGGVADFGLTTPATSKAAAAIGRATVGFVWGEKKQSLVIDVIGTRKSLGSTKDLQSEAGAADMKLSGNKLLLTWKAGTAEAKQVCEFDKQP